MDAKEALLARIHSRESSSSEHDDDSLACELDDLDEPTLLAPTPSTRHWRWSRHFFAPTPTHGRGGSGSSLRTRYTPRRRRSLLCRAVQVLELIALAIPALIIAFAIFFPSYSYPPQRYLELRDRVQEQRLTANVNNEKVFIAASLLDKKGELLSGPWARSVLQLVDILGKDNVFLSIYEDDPTQEAQVALDNFGKNVTCQHQLFTEKLDKNKLPHVSTPDGDVRLKRIEFLATVRNRALRPLQDPTSPTFNTKFDKLLYLNDVMFDPIDAANLLFSTNADEETGRTQYRAACAVDFINPVKFYDTFATRDLEGFSTGVPFYPWFAPSGAAESRKDVLQQKDAVRVKSCWGGMVAFEAKWFQTHLERNAEADSLPAEVSDQGTESKFHTAMPRVPSPGHITNNTSLRFRAETDTYWDASECCLIHADLTFMDPESLPINETGIYMNPYIRVSYDSWVLPWLSFTKRFERLYTPVQSIVSAIAGMPFHNERRTQQPGEEVVDKVWVWDAQTLTKLKAGTVKSPDDMNGHFHEIHRTAQPGGFCGLRKLLYITENPVEGERKWGTEKLPAFD
ncbi:glycosyltransferase family 69 protein [Dothistroma septosporum NZE10]|uniref:Glycosyltransferase family 69 protein n=1 Tax=Dothistroma septosporum (strain NZE10 / CBS 128990) TaxID=675120 RepID=N1PRC7_DOTSN|nr:glycosyltransferase family 69 protein [Dothistroma septosporum NZE10]